MSAQETLLRGAGNRLKSISSSKSAGEADSLHHRNPLEDSITVSFRYLDSTRNYKIDSSISDFGRRYPIPPTSVYLSNIGSAEHSLLFSPSFNAGWDPGHHAFDAYKYQLDKVRFFTTTRPYSEINYLLGSRVEQIIELVHTQNIKPNWNAGFQYRLINSSGFFKNQKNNHNNYLFNSWYQSNSKRYNNYFVLLGNKLQASENGGLKNDQDYLDEAAYKDRFGIPTNLGGDEQYTTNFFSNSITTGNTAKDFTFMMRQQYDFGRKDSLVTDSTITPLYYPRIRFEHTFTYTTHQYDYFDYAHSTNLGSFYEPDSAYYQDNYGITLKGDTVAFHEKWRQLSNDFSIYQYPDPKNQQQFIKLGATVENLTGDVDSVRRSFYNVFGHAEYRNKSRNQQWNIEANGKLYFTGLNAGDYQAFISLQRYAGKRNGYVQLGFQNSNRTPSFEFDSRSSFYLLHANTSFKKENNTDLSGSLFIPALKFKLAGHYFLSTNYTYITQYYQLQQQNSLFNVVQLQMEKTLKLSRHWNLHSEVYLQQAIGNAPVNLPAIYTRNRIAYEGNLGYKSLDIAMGFEVRYHSPYKADGYSPVLSQFYVQNSVKISQSLPDLGAYLNFRIRSFKAFIHIDNLNTARTGDAGFGFTNNNFVAPGYAMPGLQFRLGIYWSFVN